jgi:hypothetical protein
MPDLARLPGVGLALKRHLASGRGLSFDQYYVLTEGCRENIQSKRCGVTTLTLRIDEACLFWRTLDSEDRASHVRDAPDHRRCCGSLL